MLRYVFFDLSAMRSLASPLLKQRSCVDRMFSRAVSFWSSATTFISCLQATSVFATGLQLAIVPSFIILHWTLRQRSLQGAPHFDSINCTPGYLHFVLSFELLGTYKVIRPIYVFAHPFADGSALFSTYGGYVDSHSFVLCRVGAWSIFFRGICEFARGWCSFAIGARWILCNLSRQSLVYSSISMKTFAGIALHPSRFENQTEIRDPGTFAGLDSSRTQYRQSCPLWFCD